MVYVIDSAHGVFVGAAMGLAFFSKMDTAAQTQVATFPTPDDAQGLLDALRAEGVEGLRVVPVASGHWSHLVQAGLDVADMAHNATDDAPATLH